MKQFTPFGLAMLALVFVVSVAGLWLWTWLMCWSLMIEFHMRYVVCVLLTAFGIYAVARLVIGDEKK